MFNVAHALENLAASITTHAALRNGFYDRWMSAPLDRSQMETFARNYLARTTNTSTMVTLSLLRTADVRAKTEIAKNLFSEFGYGDPEHAHIVLLQRFLATILGRLGGKPYDIAELEKIPLLPTTVRFIKVQRELYTSDDECAVLGTLMAQEWLAFSMLTRLYEGARHYMKLFGSLDEFHENCEYFYVHIGEAEKEHREQAIRSANLVCRTEPQLAQLELGFDKFLAITADFWFGLADAIEEPQSVAA